MFWNSDEERMQKALARFRDKFELGADANRALEDLINWLAKQHAARSEEWSHEELLQALMGPDDFDQESVLKEVKDGLQALETFASTLVAKLAAFHAALTAEQRQQLAEEFKKHGHKHRRWLGWNRKHRLHHRDAA